MDISNNIKKMAETEIQKMPDTFTMLENIYKQSREKLSKSDFANSASRYTTELAQVQKLNELAQKSGNQDKIKYYSNLEKEIRNKLAEFGFEFY